MKLIISTVFTLALSLGSAFAHVPTGYDFRAADMDKLTNDADMQLSQVITPDPMPVGPQRKD